MISRYMFLTERARQTSDADNDNVVNSWLVNDAKKAHCFASYLGVYHHYSPTSKPRRSTKHRATRVLHVEKLLVPAP